MYDFDGTLRTFDVKLEILVQHLATPIHTEQEIAISASDFHINLAIIKHHEWSDIEAVGCDRREDNRIDVWFEQRATYTQVVSR